MDEPREIDWSTAVVKDGALSVELTGEPSRRWAEHMEGVLARLEQKHHAAIKVGKRRIKVAAVAEDAVEEMRHLLEGAVQQTNADLSPPAEAGGDESEEAAPQGADRTLTEAFRAFAPAQGAEASPGE